MKDNPNNVLRWPGDSSLLQPMILAKFQCGHPQEGCQIQVGWVKLSYFWPISHYLRHGARSWWA